MIPTWFDTADDHDHDLPETADVLSIVRPREIRPTVEAAVRSALVCSARSRWAPSWRMLRSWRPTAPEFAEHLETIEPLLAHPFWERLSGLGAGFRLQQKRRSMQHLFDLVAAPSKHLPGRPVVLISVMTSPPLPHLVEAAMPMMGAGIAALIDRHVIQAQPVTIWAEPGKVSLVRMDGDQCLEAWVDVLDILRPLEMRSSAERS